MRSEVRKYDVIIVGASVAGSSLALQLGKMGVSVALVDKQKFPRRKACGEGLSDIAVEALRRFGVTDTDVEQLQGKSFYAYRLDFGNKSLRFASSGSRRLKGIGVKRFCLDALLFDKAADYRCIDTFTGNAVTDCVEEDSQIKVTLKSGEIIHGSYVVLADGANSPGAARLGIPKTVSKRTNWGISYSLTGGYLKETKEVLVILKHGFEVYCTPVSNTGLSVALLTTKNCMRQLQDPDLVCELLAEACGKSFFNGRAEGKPLPVGPIGARRPYVRGRAILLGDAAESFDPVSGVGMTHGILQSEAAAKALNRVINLGESAESAFHDYAKDAAAISRPLRGFTRLTASLLRSPGRRFLIPLVSLTHTPGWIRNSLSEGRPAIFRSFLDLVGSGRLCIRH